MRDIKLKAWYVAGKHWFTDFSLSNDGQTVYETGDRYSVADEEVILVQFTGLKDKVGKEIYCSDMVRAFEYWTDEYFQKTDEVLNEIEAEVYFDEKIVGWALKNNDIELMFTPLSNFDSFEIIGNKFQSKQ
jgi:uncharacterized phage protein (TIGR01671 family)